MILRSLLCAVVAMFPLAAVADVSAIGRLENTSTSQTCTGALIAPNLVLTAAHCIGAVRSAEGANDARVVFRPGGVVGAPTFAVSRMVEHPLYPITPRSNGWKLRFDMAVFELEADVPPAMGRALTVGSEARLGETLFLVSWRGEDGQKPRQRACDVIIGARGLVTVGCAVSGGESGAPLLRKTEAGLEVVAVLSSRMSQRQQPVGLASNVDLRLPPILAAMDEDTGS